MSVGPSRALYPDSPFLNSFLYVPNAYVAGGRTTSIAIADTCKPGNCRLYITPAGGGIWTAKNGLAGTPHWEYLGGPLGINSAGAVTIDSNDPTGKTVYVGTGEANICGSGCVAGVGIYKSTDGGETWTGPLGGGDTGNPLAGQGRRQDPDQARKPQHDLRSHDDGPPRHVRVVLCGRHPAGSRRGQVGPLQVDERRRHVELHPQRLRQRGRLHRIAHRVQQRRRMLTARRPLAGIRPVELGDPLRGLVRTRSVAVTRRRRHLDADQAVSERDPDPDSSEPGRHQAGQRQHADVRL